MYRLHPSASRRSGFTLVELMVVIAIIGLLAVISLRIIGGLLAGARQSATIATIKKIEGLLNQRIDAITHINIQPAAYVAAQRTGANAALAKVLAHKDVLRQYCPQSFATELDLTPYMTVAANHTAATESAELLYYFLTNPNANVPGYAPSGVDAFSTSEVADTDGDGLLEFVDGWRQPIRFYRWPTRLIRPLGAGNPPDRVTASLLMLGLPPVPAAGVDPLNVDSDDPFGRAADANNGYATLGLNFETDYHTLNTYHTPLIISAGEDGILGLYETSNLLAGTEGYLARPIAGVDLSDNISNLNQRAGGR